MPSVPQAQYHALLYSTAGNLVAVLTDFTRLSYTRRLNEPGSYDLTVAETSQLSVPLSSLPSLLVEDAIVVVMRRIPDAGIDWYQDFAGFHRDESYETASDGALTVTSRGVGTLDLLARRVVNYPAGTRQVAKRAASATAVYQYVEENAGASATTANGRYANGQTTGLTVTAPTGSYSTWDGGRHMQNVLSVIQGISLDAGDVEFEMETTAGGGIVAHVFEPVPRIGTDRSATVVFSKPRGNVGSPLFSRARTASRNRVIVLGPGEEADRVVRVVNDTTAQAASPWALSEMAREATQEETISALDGVGRAALAEQQVLISYAFTPIETPSTRYGRDYFLGDTVTAVADDGTAIALRIVGVTVTIDGASGAESIDLDVSVLT